MTLTRTAKKEELSGLFSPEQLTHNLFKISVSPITEAEADDIEFKSLKGIAGKWLDVDEVRKERLHL